jgi:hypothetical protein
MCPCPGTGAEALAVIAFHPDAESSTDPALTLRAVAPSSDTFGGPTYAMANQPSDAAYYGQVEDGRLADYMTPVITTDYMEPVITTDYVQPVPGTYSATRPNNYEYADAHARGVCSLLLAGARYIGWHHNCRDAVPAVAPMYDQAQSFGKSAHSDGLRRPLVGPPITWGCHAALPQKWNTRWPLLPVCRAPCAVPCTAWR